LHPLETSYVPFCRTVSFVVAQTQSPDDTVAPVIAAGLAVF
jgi:hypothetical protein